MTKDELARHVVDLHEKGFVCGAEVFNVFLDHLSEDTLEQFMQALSPQLVARFQHSIEEFLRDPAAYFPLERRPKKLWKMRSRAELMRGWLRQRYERGAPRNAGPAERLGNSGAGGGPPSVS